jgi:hypothetical protein
MRTPRATRMWVSTVDKDGKDLGDGHWVDIPKPDEFRSNGFAQIEKYVSRLLQSSASFASIIIATPDQQTAVLLWKRAAIAEFSVSVEWRSEPERERALRQFFADRKLASSHDYLAGNGGVADATRCLGYFLPSDVQFITTLTKDLLQHIYKLREQDAVNFTYDEKKQ